jgi:hypothetical protein
MQICGFRVNGVVGLALLMSLLASQAAFAAVVDFESPTYATGEIVAQNGWVRGGYIGPGFNVNGTTVVSTTAPLSGAQSFSYDQNTTAAGTAASDVAKASLITAPGGTAGADLTVSYLLSVTGNATNPTGSAGLFLSNAASSGSSPMFARIVGTTLDTGTGPIAGFVYTPGQVLRVTYGVDFDAQNFQLTVFNQTTNTTDFQGTRGFFAAYPATGPGGSYVVDVGLFLRGGSAKFDDITLNAVPEPVGISSLLIGLAFIGTRRRQ